VEKKAIGGVIFSPRTVTGQEEEEGLLVLVLDRARGEKATGKRGRGPRGEEGLEGVRGFDFENVFFSLLFSKLPCYLERKPNKAKPFLNM
jgi:hypothetical protein